MDCVVRKFDKHHVGNSHPTGPLIFLKISSKKILINKCAMLLPLLFDGGEMSTGAGGEMSTGDGGIPANAGTGSRRRGLPEKKGYNSYR